MKCAFLFSTFLALTLTIKASNDVIASSITALVASIDWPEFKKDAPLLANLAKTTSRAVDDLYFVNNVKMVMDPESFIPSISYAFDTMNTLSGVLIDPVRTTQKLMNQTGMLRPISYVLDEE